MACGSHHATLASPPLPTGNTAACGWQLSLPVLDPAAILTLAVFQQSRGGKAKGRPGFLPASAVQVCDQTGSPQTGSPAATAGSAPHRWQALGVLHLSTLHLYACSSQPVALARPPLVFLQAVGKLRVRLSCLWPNTQHSASLPLLGDRAKGAQVVGAVSLSLQACYSSTVGRVNALAFRH